MTNIENTEDTYKKNNIALENRIHDISNDIEFGEINMESFDTYLYHYICGTLCTDVDDADRDIESILSLSKEDFKKLLEKIVGIVKKDEGEEREINREKLKENGWDECNDTFTKTWNLCESQSDYDYTNDLLYYCYCFKDLVFCTYKINIFGKTAEYMLHFGNKSTREGTIFEEDYETVLNDARMNNLFWPVEKADFELIHDSNRSSGPDYIDLIRAKKDYQSCWWGCKKGDYFLKCYGKNGDSNEFLKITDEQAKEIMNLDNFDDQLDLIFAIWEKLTYSHD